MNNVTVNKSIRLSQHFTLGEMTRTGTGIPNIPSRVIIENLRNICENWLEEMRRRYNERYVVEEGGRFFEEGGRRKEEGEYFKGREEGGVRSENREEAEDLSGCAVDIRCAGFEQAVRYASILLDIADDTGQDYDELFIERKKTVRYWLHFAVRPEGNRRKNGFLL